MQVDVMQYVQMKKVGAVKLVKMGGTEGQDDEQVDGVAIVFVKKFDQQTGAMLMPDLGPINLQELLAVRDSLQKGVDGANQLLADMSALKVPTTLPKPPAA